MDGIGINLIVRLTVRVQGQIIPRQVLAQLQPAWRVNAEALLERGCREEKKISRCYGSKSIKDFPSDMLETVLIDKHERWILADLTAFVAFG